MNYVNYVVDLFQSPCLQYLLVRCSIYFHMEKQDVSIKPLACGLHPIDLVRHKANKRLAFCVFDILMKALLEKL